MTARSRALVEFGFLKNGKNKITVDGKTYSIEGRDYEARKKSLAEIDGQVKNKKDFEKEIARIADHEIAELSKNQLVTTDYPASLTRYVISLESWHQSIEQYYFWCLNFLNDLGFPMVHKITDIFSASEHSSFYGAAGQRLGLAQDKVGQYLATIGKMIKDLFQLVRELRWIDERLEVYREAFAQDKEGNKLPKLPSKGAEVTLKGMWADLVDGVVGGQRTGSNIFTMQQQLQFTSLPDLFFSIHPQDINDIDKVVQEQAGSFNESLRNVLSRKLHQYIAWKKATYDEIRQRRRFTLDYLRQHYYVIKLYISWIKPYLRHIERLTGSSDLFANPRLVSAFESSLIELEVLAKIVPAGESAFSCILLTFEYHTKPAMQYTGDAGYHRGPIHVGTTQITWRSYAWTEDQIKDYIKYKEAEDINFMLTAVDDSLKSSMEQLKSDIEKYLDEAQKQKPDEEKGEKKNSIDLLEPFTAVGKGIYETFGALIPNMPKLSFGKKREEKGVSDGVKGMAKKLCFVHYNVFKKAHGLLSW